MQVVVWLAHYKPKQLVKHKLVAMIIEALCSLAAESAPDDHDEDDDDELPSKFATQALDDIARSVASKHVLPSVRKFAQAYILAAGASQRIAACQVVAASAEGCCEGMRSSIDSVLPVLVQGLGDSDAGVRAAALFGIGQFAGALQYRFPGTLSPTTLQGHCCPGWAAATVMHCAL